MWELRVIPLMLEKGNLENFDRMYPRFIECNYHQPIRDDSEIGETFFVKHNYGRNCNFSVKGRNKGVYTMDGGPNGFR